MRHTKNVAVLVFAFFLYTVATLYSDASANWDPRPATGTRNLLVVLTSFADRPFITSPSSWYTAILDTTPGVKSVANYYSDNSLGNLTIVPVPHSQPGYPAGIVSVTLASNHPNYGNNFNLSTETAWLQEALNIITANGWVDFQSFDANSDGIFQNDEMVIFFIPAGYDTAFTVKTPSIWAHAWGTTPGLSAGGIELRRWAMNGELDNNDSQLTIGTQVHEMGHAIFGLPDLYDLTHTNSGMGAFSPMGMGSSGSRATGESSGTTPVALDAWSRQYLGWTTPIEAHGPDTFTFLPALDPTSSPLKLIKPAASTSQYFLAENRYNEGWDLGLERWFGTEWGGGILIQHIDISVGTSPFGEYIWGGNDINRYTAGSHQGVMVEEASTVNGSLLEGSAGHYTHLFYDSNNSAFTDSSLPDSKLYGGASTGLSLTGISTKGRVMTGTVGLSAAAIPDFFSKASGTGSISVDAATEHYWTATSNDAWITLDQASSGTGSGSVGFGVSENSQDEQRQGTVSVDGQTVTITQEGTVTVSPSSASVGYNGGSGAVLIQCSPVYAWSASSNDFWITITGSFSGSGPGTIYYAVQPNTSMSRQGTITVAGKTITVEQAGNPGDTYFDNCATPKAIDCLPFTDFIINTMTFTNGINDPVPSCGMTSGTMWYSFSSSTFSGDVTISTAGSNYDTVIGVYSGTCDALVEVACNNDTADPPSPQSSVTFFAMPNSTYYIMVGGANGESGNLSLNVTSFGGMYPTCPRDTIAPVSMITANAETDAELTLSGVASDGGGGGVFSVEVSIDGGPWHPATDTSGNWSWSSWSYTTAMPADGNHYFQSRAQDAVGNTETPSRTYMLQLENTRPTSSIVSPLNGAVISGKNCSINGMADDGAGSGIAKVEVSTNGGLTWEPTDYYPGASWSYNWIVGSPGSHNIKSRATDKKGNVEIPGAGVTVTVNAIGTPELQHFNWEAWLSGGICEVCHTAAGTFVAPDFRNDNSFCYSCHNAAGVSHGSGLYGNGHSTMVNATSAGAKMPTYGNITAGETNNQPFSRLSAGKVVCVTCHNVMQKPEDMGRTWEYTTTTDNLTYTMANLGWEGYRNLVPKVYRDTSLWAGPTYSKKKKDYIVSPSEYTYNEDNGTITFLVAQDLVSCIYVSLDYPYLRASNANKTLCGDCHTQQTHKGENCQTCHAAHNTANIKGIKESLRAPNRTSFAVKFLRYTGINSFADGDTTFDGICEVCHTQTKYYRRDGSGFANHSGGVNQNGTDCTACHTHSSGFAR